MNKLFLFPLLLVFVASCATNKYNNSKSYQPKQSYSTNSSQFVVSDKNYSANDSGNSVVASANKEEVKEFVFSGNQKSTTEKLPKGYRGDNFIQVYNSLSGSVPKKGEFEKTSDYQDRIRILEGKVCAFLQVLDKQKKESIFKYDPDTENLVVMPHTSFLSLYQVKNSYVEFVISGSSANTGNRVGQNAFGARVVVKEYKESFCTVKASNSATLLSATNPKGKDPNFSIKMSPSDAKRHKGSLDILILGVTPSDSLSTYTDSHYIEPKFHSPTEILTMHKGINLKILQIWVFNSLTGEVIEKKIIEDV